LCSHIFYAFATMGDDYEIKALESNDEKESDGSPGLYERVNSLKEKQADLRTILSFGGFLFGQEKGELMKKMLMDINGENRETFILSVISHVRHHHFDGIDFNYYPDAESKDAFAQMIEELRQGFDAEARISHRAPLILTVGVNPMVERIEAGFDMEKLSRSVDFFNVMTFDYHGSWDNVTGINMPLFDTNDHLSVNTTISYLMNERNVSKSLLVLGFAAYGRGWMVANDTSLANSIGVPALGPSPPQPFTNASGVAAYHEICDLIEKSNFEVQRNELDSTPYALKDGVWYSYDDIKSYDVQLDWLIELDLAGGFVWELAMDDFSGRCSSSNGSFPLVKEIRSKVESKQETTVAAESKSTIAVESKPTTIAGETRPATIVATNLGTLLTTMAAEIKTSTVAVKTSTVAVDMNRTTILAESKMSTIPAAVETKLPTTVAAETKVPEMNQTTTIKA